MSAQSQLESLFDSLNISDEHQQQVEELKSSYNDDCVETFLEKLNAMDNIDELIDSSENSQEKSDQFIDLVSELIINK